MLARRHSFSKLFRTRIYQAIFFQAIFRDGFHGGALRNHPPRRSQKLKPQGTAQLGLQQSVYSTTLDRVQDCALRKPGWGN
jgi:hypothetical protein